MQIAKATSILVNRGTRIAPHLLRATIVNGERFDKQELSDLDNYTYPPIKGVKK